ncbi:MAG: ATP-binding protein [Brevibacterium aurantiacum]|uniref:AAA ATPase domain-containing protein n=1 Tax=Brevibacterium aurantiacum TaxID=273384 RepID=A0A2A3X0J7_BREAU|nr:ATP-binding protein [Brevibacterium aurantiacum]MDN5585201.1 ATP-binding protein [Brevibacterium sp.]PCC17196.1 hypothetical protein CIK79_02105 [Brevibacterium aurantiacum]PCC48693.1 hypothetical protein CIK62_16665 [Brevibacterium aurantiacum]PCC57171.1 hypothetical protein CIK58_10615 [Brevibacterium aurantiacum]RCS89847.1 ATP-binding protein [Brevibacterium aurantiacum]
MSLTIPPPPASNAPQSPFTPTFGTTPPAVVGRQDEVNDFAYALDSGPGAKGRATFVTGQRGVGKSVMLNIFHEVAASRQWVGLHAQASPGFVDTITHARLPEVLEKLEAPETVKSKIVGANVSIMGFGGGVTPARESPDQLYFELGFLPSGHALPGCLAHVCHSIAGRQQMAEHGMASSDRGR